MEEKERRRQQQLAEEGQFRQELYAKFAREAKLEQMTRQRRKLAILEHNREVKKTLKAFSRKCPSTALVEQRKLCMMWGE